MPSNHASLSHGVLLRRYRLPIAGTFVLLVLENMLELALPYLLGRAIDGLIAGSFHDWRLYLGIAVAMILIAVGRRMYDTRAYQRIYREVGDETAAREAERAAGPAKITARVNFVKDFTDFFEIMLPMAMVSAFTLIGSVAMLTFLSPRLGLGALAVALLVGLVFAVSRKRIVALNTSLNDEMERQVDLLGADPPRRAGHFRALTAWRIALSDLEARNFGLVQLFTTLLVAGALVQLIRYDQASEGQVFAALTYLLQFAQSVVILPYTYQEFVRTREIGQRLSREEPEGEG